MKRLLSLLALGLFTAAASAQVAYDSAKIGHGQRLSGHNAGNSHSSPPVTNPEPLTLVALAGGAAVAGGLLRKRKQAK